MKSIALSAFGFSSLVVAGVLEFFAQRSSRQGGLALSTTDSDVPTFVTFSYQFLPTIVAVFYSLAWAWIDSDVRRMQPWLDLSRPGGASGDSTLSVDYPFEFLAFVPFKAWKRRHWPVFLTGTAMMVIFWLITPLQSAIFGMRSVKVSKVIGLRHDVGMIPLQEQRNRIDVSILNLAYATTWLGQSLPAFSTPEASLLPFLPAEEFQTFGSNYTYTGETVEYATDLQCWPAKWRRPSGQETFEADNGRGCLTNVTVPTSHAVKGGDTTVLLYVGWHQDARSDWWLASPTCGPQASNQFLTLWTKLDNLQNATLIFCETSYAKQTVSATISGSSHEPLERLPSPVGNLQVLGSDKFNSTAFEYLIGTGVPDNLSHKGIGQVIYLDQTVRLDAYRIAYPFTNMVGFAVGLYKNGSVDDFQNPIILSKAFRDAHKALFSVAISQLMSPIPRPVEFLGSVDAELFGVVVSRPISLIVEILLVVVAIISGFLLFLCSGYESSLRNDPSSLGSLLEMLRSSESLLGDFTTMDRLNDHDLAEQISQKQYRLEKATPGASGLIRCSQLRRVDQQHETKSGYHSSSSRSSYDYQPVRPKELLPVTGLILITILISATTFLIYLKRQEGIIGGLPRPTDSFEVLQILENYLPTIFATFLEPFLVLLTRLACVFQPFHQLKQGKASSQTTLDISYESLPPQLNVLRALRSGSFLLAAMCCLSLLVNILAVGMGAIFNEASAQVGYLAMGRLVREPALVRNTIRPPTYSTRYYEAFYILLANTSAGTRLPPWTDSKHVYLPYEYPNNREQDQSLQFHTLTRGFGFDPNCLPLSMSQNDPVHANYSSYYFISSFRNNLLVSFKKESGAELLCYLDPYVIEDNHVQGPASVEMIGTLHPFSNNDRTVTHSLPDDGSCEASFVAVWMKANQSTHGGDSSTTGVLCQPELRTAMFNLTTDRGGYVLDSRRVGGFDDLSKMLSPGQILNLTNEAIKWVGDPDRVNVGPAWHNDTLSRDWLNYLADIELNSTRLVDPREPVVGMEDALAVTTRFFERTSAALLGANLDMFRAINDTSQPVGGVVVRRETRIFMNNPAFLISVVILGVNIIVLTVLYTREREPYLPRMPSSIASTIAYVAAGRTVAEYRRKGKDERSYGTEDGSIEKMSREPTYSFGHFIGVDGKPHIGIEVDPFVLPLEVSKQNEMSFVSRFFGLRQRKSSDKGQLVSNLE